MLQANEHVLDYVDSYLHGALTPAEDTLIEQHCENCRICAVALEEAQKRLTLFQAVPASEASNQLIQQTLARIEKYDPQRIRLLWRRALLTVAAVVLVLGGLHLYFLNLSPSPYDLQVLGQVRLFAGTHASVRVRVFDHDRALGLSNVPVAIALRHQKRDEVVHLASFNTDAEGTGTPRFRLPEWPDGDYELRVTAEPGGRRQDISRMVSLKRSWRVMLTSDRPVYQPGQEIHVRALALGQQSLQPVAGQETVFTVSDPKGTVIFKHHDVTSKFGICAADCPLATEILEGTYTIRATVGDTISSQAVEVKKYVLPKFRIALDPDRPFYESGQRVRGKVRADYFFGKPVVGAAVELELGEHSVKLRTDDTGVASFAFPALPAEVLEKDKSLELRATVTDSAGQKQVWKIEVLVAAQPLRIEVIPEAGKLVAHVPNIIYVLTTSPDGRPQKARLTISGFDKEMTTNALGVASFEYLPQTADVEWLIVATDDEAKRSQAKVTLSCDPGETAFLIRTERAVYKAGDSIRLSALGNGKQPIFVDLLKNGQTMLTSVIAMSAGHGELTVDLPPDLCGTVELFAYRLTDPHPVHTRRVVYIHTPNEINVGIQGTGDVYRPGTRARIRFALTGKNGEPIGGALSLSAVDEAVFAVLTQTTGVERSFFADDPEMLQPIRALFPWSPAMTLPGSNEDRQRLERALFARAGTKKKGMNREELIKILLPFVENNRWVFESLDAPGGEHLISEMIPEPARSILQDKTWGHSLSAATYPDAQRETAATRENALKVLKGIWIFLGLLAVVAMVVLLIVELCRRFNPALILLPLSLLLMCWITVPQVQQIREASARTQTNNDIKQIGLAIQAAQDTYKKPPWAHLAHADPQGSTDLPRVRDWFPETLLWRPELITDDSGRASLDLDLPDSITTWRLTASAVTATGRLGAAQSAIKVFQPFFVDLNLPVALTRGDQVTVPVVLYNYLDKAQLVDVKLDEAKWFDCLDDPAQRITLDPREVRSTHYRLRVRQVGSHEMLVTARGSGVADAVKRRIGVVPDGRRVETVWNGTLQDPAAIKLDLPQDAIEGSPTLLVKIYPSTFSQLVEGLDAIFHMPYGCFEQTSSTTYPNVLALDYLRRINKSLPAIESKARNYIHLGYQRLLGFEVTGGGFDWFGRPPANRTLTAYGLMEFQDMARVHDVDPQLIERTRNWLLKQRRPDGSWEAEGHVPHGLQGNTKGAATVTATAYIAWAVFAGHSADAGPTRDFLLRRSPDSIQDPYTLALVANALLAIGPDGADAMPYLQRLESLKQTSAAGKLVFWQQETRTTFYGSGRSASVEATSLATLAFLKANLNPATSRAALGWLVQMKNASGTWDSTQATILALRALLAGTGRPLGDGERHIQLAINGTRRLLTIPADQAEVMKLVELSDQLGAGANTLAMSANRDTAPGYQVVFRYHVPEEKRRLDGPLAIELLYDRARLQVGESVAVTAKIMNRQKDTSHMVLVELPVPGGFIAEADTLDQLRAAGMIAKYQLQPHGIHLYLREVEPAKEVRLQYRVRSQMPVQVHVPPARVYEYYDPQRFGISESARLVVTK